MRSRTAISVLSHAVSSSEVRVHEVTPERVIVAWTTGVREGAGVVVVGLYVGSPVGAHTVHIEHSQP